jgi:putative aldouronate transport system substrate-binding protein
VFSRKTKLAVAALTAAATAITVAGCTAQDDPNDAATLSVFAMQGPEEDLETNSFSLAMEELTGIEFDWETTTLDSAGAAEARQIALASGDYPEAFMLTSYVDAFSQEEVQRFGGQGVLVPLNDLIEENAPNVVEFFDAYPDYREIVTAPDGNIYGLAQYDDCYHCQYQSKLWINGEWLDTLGLDMPETTEELFEVLTAFKTQDPNGNGVADEIPLSSSVNDVLLPYFVNAFLYDPRGSDVYPSSLALDDGSVVEQAAQDAYRDALAYMHRLHDAGLIDDGAFTQNREALSAKGNNAGTQIVGSFTGLHPYILVSPDQEDGRDRIYEAVPPVAGPDGVRLASYNSVVQPRFSFTLTNKASEEEQIAAIEIIDYLFSFEGAVTSQYGEKGVGWQDPSEGMVALDSTLEPLYEPITVEGDAPTNYRWADGAGSRYNSPREMRGSIAIPADTDVLSTAGYERRLFAATQLYEEFGPDESQIFPYWALWVPTEDAGELAELTTNIQSLISQASAEFVTGVRDVDDDAAWQSYLDALDGLGLERYLELQQEAYDAKF